MTAVSSEKVRVRSFPLRNEGHLAALGLVSTEGERLAQEDTLGIPFPYVTSRVRHEDGEFSLMFLEGGAEESSFHVIPCNTQVGKHIVGMSHHSTIYDFKHRVVGHYQMLVNEMGRRVLLIKVLL